MFVADPREARNAYVKRRETQERAGSTHVLSQTVILLGPCGAGARDGCDARYQNQTKTSHDALSFERVND